MKSNWKATRRIRNNILSSSWKSHEDVRTRIQHVCTVWDAGGRRDASGAFSAATLSFVWSSVLLLHRGSLSARLECRVNRWQSISQAGSYTNCRSVQRYTWTHTSTQKSHSYLISVFLLFCPLSFIHSFCLPDVFNLWPRGRRCLTQRVFPPNVTPLDILRVYEGSVQEKVGCHIYRLTFTSPCADRLK